MEKFETTELMELVPCELQKTLTKKQTLLLGYLIMLNGLEESKTNGTFYRSNEDILEDLAGEITKPTLISSIRRLETLNLIERSSGYRTKDGKQASTYKIIENNIFKNQSNMNGNEITLELVKVIRAMQEQINFQNKIIGKILLNQNLTLNLTHQNPLNTEVSEDMGKIQLNENLTLNLTPDTDIDKEIDINNNINKIINNIKETSNNINNKLNKIEEKENIINNIQEKESELQHEVEEVKENELASAEFKNEVEDNELNESQVEKENTVESIEDEEEEVDDTSPLTDEQLEAKLTEYFNKQKDTITNDSEYNDFETVFNMVLQNFQDNEQITKEQFSHAKLFTVQPLLSQLRRKVYTRNDEKASTEPQKEETLTTTQPIKENVSERQEMALNEKTETATPTEESLISVFEEMAEEEKHSKKSSYKEGELDCEQALAMLKPRMYELYAQATSLAELNEKYKKIVDGLQKWHEEGKINQVAFGCIKSRAWQINNDFSKKIYGIN